MKKILLTALACGATMLSANAAKEYVIYQSDPLGENQVLISGACMAWNGASFANENGVSTWTPVAGTGWWGGGWKASEDETVDISVLNDTNCKLVFEYNTTSNATLKFKMANEQSSSPAAFETQPITTFVRDGQWHIAEFDVRTTFPGVLESLHNGDVADLFAPVGGGDWAEGETISFRNIKFVEGEKYVAPTYEYGAKWYGTFETTKNFGGKDHYVSIDYVLTALNGGDIQMDATIEGYEDLILEMHIGDKWQQPQDLGDGHYRWTTADANFELGKSVTVQLWFKYAGGQIDDILPYMFGAANGKPVTAIVPKVIASVQNITATTAEIAYDVTLPEELADAYVTVFYNDTEATTSPIALTGLTADTEYSYSVKAVATKDGKTYESKPRTVTFKTTRDATVAVAWHTVVDGFVKNAYLIGEDAATSRRDIPVSIETTVSWNPNGSITVDAVPHGTQNIVGFVPKISVSASGFIHDGQVMATNSDGSWTYTTPDGCNEGLDFLWLKFVPAYDNTTCDLNINGYKAGDSNDKPVWGTEEVSSIDLSLSQTELLHVDNCRLTAIAKNNNGHYLPDNLLTISVEGSSLKYENHGLVLTGESGESTITATAGDAIASKTVNVLTNSSATMHKVEAAAVSSTDTTPLASYDAAFDGNEGTQIEWAPATGEEHNLTVDLGANRHVQVVQLIWEGASAKEYTVTLTPAQADPAAMQAKVEAADHVFTVNDGEGGAGVIVRKNLYNSGMTTFEARTVALDTKKAYTPDWGIKLKEMKILYTDNKVSTLVNEMAADADALVDVYNLQGVRVMKGVKTVEIINLPAGIYIANGKKFIVK